MWSKFFCIANSTTRFFLGVSALQTCVRCQHDTKWAQFSLDNFFMNPNKVQVTYLQKTIIKTVVKVKYAGVWALTLKLVMDRHLVLQQMVTCCLFELEKEK